jgi:hypothetical protein
LHTLPGEVEPDLFDGESVVDVGKRISKDLPQIHALYRSDQLRLEADKTSILDEIGVGSAKQTTGLAKSQNEFDYQH